MLAIISSSFVLVKTVIIRNSSPEVPNPMQPVMVTIKPHIKGIEVLPFEELNASAQENFEISGFILRLAN